MDLKDINIFGQEEVISDGSDYFNRRIVDISEAIESIDLEVFIFSLSASRGVAVKRLLPGHSDVFFMPWAANVF